MVGRRLAACARTRWSFPRPLPRVSLACDHAAFVRLRCCGSSGLATIWARRPDSTSGDGRSRPLWQSPLPAAHSYRENAPFPCLWCGCRCGPARCCVVWAPFPPVVPLLAPVPPPRPGLWVQRSVDVCSRGMPARVPPRALPAPVCQRCAVRDLSPVVCLRVFPSPHSGTCGVAPHRPCPGHRPPHLPPGRRPRAPVVGHRPALP